MDPKNRPTLYQQPGCRWWYYSVYHEDGTRERESCREYGLDTGIPRDEALRRLLPRLGYSPPSETLAWFKSYLEERGDPNLAPSTWRLYLRDFGRLIDALGADFLLREVRLIPHVARFQDSLRARGWKPVTINITCRSVQALFRRALHLGLVDANPFADFERLREPAQVKHLDPAQLDAFLAIARAWRPQRYKKTPAHYEGLRRLVIIYLYIPYRRGELLSVRREHISITTVTDSQGIPRTSGQLRIPNSKKRDDPLETVDLHPDIIPDILWFLDTFPGPAPFALYHPDTISHYFRYWLRLAGVPDDVHPVHGLRHTALTLAANQPDANLRAIQQHVGHSTITVTEKYVHGKSRGKLDLGKNYTLPPNNDAQEDKKPPPS